MTNAANDIKTDVLILGAGPAGLTAAYELSKHNVPSIVIERDAIVGGLARTVNYKGNRFDIGGHRFYTKISFVEQLWREILGDDLLRRPRLSRIYYRSKFFNYPLQPVDAIRGLGILEGLRCCLSYLSARMFPRNPEPDFATWVTNRFGRRLFETFFRSYTEKVWGMDCREIAADWAAQRIGRMSLGAVLRDALFPNQNRAIKSLIKQFQYPRLGPGMMWCRVHEIVEKRGGRVILNSPVEQIRWEPGGIVSVRAGGRIYRAKHFISSIPISELIDALNPAPPESVRAAGGDFHYRDFVTVALVLNRRDLFPDNWIYVHDPAVRVARIQNYNNWSPEMARDLSTTCLGCEYFCSKADTLWDTPDEQLVEIAKRELAYLQLADPGDVVDATVIRVPKAYPIYDSGYKQALAHIRQFIETVPNLQLVGRNGMHRYNNQDHSMLTGVLAARNTLGARFDLWSLGLDEEYLEKADAVTEDDICELERSQPLVPV